MKPPEFAITEDPLSDDSRIFVTHLAQPVVIAEAFHFNEDDEPGWMNAKRQFEMGASVDYPGELVCLGVIYCGALPPDWPEDPKQVADRLAKVMSAMGDYYAQ